MKSPNQNTNIRLGGGTGILTILQIVFIVLKLTNTIDWSWWAVFIPSFVGVTLIIIAIAAIVVAFICQIIIDHLD